MKLTTTMIGLEDNSASLGLFGEIGEEIGLRPPHVQITVHTPLNGTRDDMRTAAIHAALDALTEARAALEAELR